MKITFNLFKCLFAFYKLHPGFNDLVLGMGHKSGPEDEHFMSCYSSLRWNNNEPASTELDACGKIQWTLRLLSIVKNAQLDGRFLLQRKVFRETW